MFVFIVVFCGFLPCQIQLAADDEEDFSLRIAAHGIERIILAGLALKDGQVNFKAFFEALQDGFARVAAEHLQQEAAIPPRLLCKLVQTAWLSRIHHVVSG
ncbi:MAG TPA: hypothetical protein H9862_00310 [Candidatus Akkermansia intestinigallinarum]|uniref:Uncharacterized protein n=1 Tax=Candidatus Akkermansia intestinigallinarum TaxID=2838431 RepID=A0A9D2AH38_9BACT|nr:hypothetical protein [Candidatus Akkermansia intestinigallinarum]